MTKEERNRLAELAAMVWSAQRHEKDYSVFYGTDFKGVRAVWVSDGLVMVKGKELANAVDDWNNQNNLSRKKKSQISGASCFVAGFLFSELLTALFNWIF